MFRTDSEANKFRDIVLNMLAGRSDERVVVSDVIVKLRDLGWRGMSRPANVEAAAHQMGFRVSRAQNERGNWGMFISL